MCQNLKLEALDIKNGQENLIQLQSRFIQLKLIFKYTNY